MASVKCVRTQEKQYTAWVTHPPIGTQIPGRAEVTTREKSWVLSAPDGVRLISGEDLARDFFFKTDKGTQPINSATCAPLLVNGVIKWTQVVRNTQNAIAVMARHVKGSANDGLGYFEVYPDIIGNPKVIKIPGNIFVRMFSLLGGLSGIATPKQAAAVTVKPKIELVSTKANTTPQVKHKPVNEEFNLPKPDGMSDKLVDIYTRFYLTVRNTAKANFGVDVTDPELFNSGYLGITFKVKEHKFLFYTNANHGAEFRFSGTDIKAASYLGTDPEIAAVKARDIFLRYLRNPRPVLSVGDKVDLNDKDYSKFENCITAELLSSGILVTIKPDVTQMELLRFPGFTGDEAGFKYSGPFNQYGQHSMLVLFKAGTSWEYSWGNSTTLTTQTVWDRNKVVVQAMEKLTGKILYGK